MYNRVPRYPPMDARMVRIEDGPALYRCLGYNDLVDNEAKERFFAHITNPPETLPKSVSITGPLVRTPIAGLQSRLMARNTFYWDPNPKSCHAQIDNCRKIHRNQIPVDRPEARVFPEMAVPGSGMSSMCWNSGYRVLENTPPPNPDCKENAQWTMIDRKAESREKHCE